MLLPSQLVTHSQSAFEQLLEHQSEAISHWPEPLIDDLKYVLGLSCFIGDSLQRDAVLSNTFPTMLACEERAEGYRERLAELLSGCADEMSGQHVLRQFRNREMT
ncbi:MAG: bifunctional glutamine synthetase adenylyltransferase/deadenyltransferase, partial [Vibrio toranzoniae]